MAGKIPPELLEKVFNHLDPDSRKAVRLVNRTWAHILWTDKWLRTQVLLINPATLTDDWVLQRMKRPFREIHITTEMIPSDGWRTIYYDRVKDLITSAVLTESVQIIKLDANVKVLNYLFYHQYNSVSYPNLEQFTFLTSVDNLCSGSVNINASFPKLNVLKLDSLSRGSARLIRIFAKQITKLVVRVAYRRQLLIILAIRNLDNLTELAIGTMAHSRSEGELLSHDDFGPQQLTLLRRLKRLEINDSANLFVFTYHFFLGEMQNLTHLKITGVELLPNVLTAASQLANLQFLQLLASSENPDYMPTMVRLNLPYLETLHLAPQLMAYAGNLPKLSTLGIINHTDRSVSWDHFAGPGAVQSFTVLKTIRKLHVRGIYFSSHNLHAIMHFPGSCKVFLEDKDGYTIGTIHARKSVDTGQLRCHYRGEIDELSIKRPAVASGDMDNDMSQFVRMHNRGCLVWFEHRLEKLGDRIVRDYKSCKRSVQRHNLYNLKKYGCYCDCYYYRIA